MERKVRPKRVQIPIDEKGILTLLVCFSLPNNRNAYFLCISLLAVTLEGLVCVPADESEQSRTGVIISHPHPMLGGSMTNNVVGSLLKEYVIIAKDNSSRF